MSARHSSMRNVHQLTPEQIDQEIENLKQQLEKQQQSELSVSDQISNLQKQNWSNYKNNLKKDLIFSISKLSKDLKEKTAFKVVCEKHLGKEFSDKMLKCFELCSRSHNWKLLQQIYNDKNVDVDNRMISFLASLYRRNVLNDKSIYLKTGDKVCYQQILADFQQIEIFN